MSLSSGYLRSSLRPPQSGRTHRPKRGGGLLGGKYRVFTRHIQGQHGYKPRPRTVHACQVCGKPFKGVSPQRSQRAKFCSHACRQKAYRQRIAKVKLGQN